MNAQPERAKIVSRIHYTESDAIRAIWDELGNIPLPQVDHLRDLFAPDPRLAEVGEQMQALGQTCLRKPPPDLEYNRRLAIQVTEDWILHLGRMTFNVSRANRLKLFWKIKEVFGEDAPHVRLLLLPARRV